MGFDLFGLGEVIGGGIGLIGNALTNSAQAANQQKQMDWQTQMSNTAHTREVADLKNAGLNPILSATGGRGASTPSTPLTNPSIDTSPIGKGVSNAASFYRSDAPRLANETAVAESQVIKNTADASASAARAASDTASLGLVNPQISKLTSEVAQIQAQTGKVPQELLNLISDMRLKDANAALAAASAKNVKADTAGKETKSHVWQAADSLFQGQLPPAYSAWAHKAAAGPPSVQNKLGDWAYDAAQAGKSAWRSASDWIGSGLGNVFGGASSAKQLGGHK